MTTVPDLSTFYRHPDQDLCQGDIICDVPHVRFEPPLRAIRERQGKQWYDYYDDPESPENRPPSTPLKLNTTGELVPSFCIVTYAILLTHDCDLINDAKNRVIGLVRRLDPDFPDKDKENVRNDRDANYFYLPAYQDMAESFVDFRRITNLPPGYAETTTVRRLASLTPDAAKSLQLQLFFFLTRRKPSKEQMDALLPERPPGSR